MSLEGRISIPKPACAGLIMKVLFGSLCCTFNAVGDDDIDNGAEYNLLLL